MSNPYHNFLKGKREDIIKLYPELKGKQILDKLRECWRNMELEEKEEWRFRVVETKETPPKAKIWGDVDGFSELPDKYHILGIYPCKLCGARELPLKIEVQDEKSVQIRCKDYIKRDETLESLAILTRDKKCIDQVFIGVSYETIMFLLESVEAYLKPDLREYLCDVAISRTSKEELLEYYQDIESKRLQKIMRKKLREL